MFLKKLKEMQGNSFIGLLLVFTLSLPTVVFAQEAQQENDPAYQVEDLTTDPGNYTNPGTLSTSPWPNSSTTTNNSGSTNDPTAVSGANARPGATAQKPVIGGGTTLASRDPGDNPDVPFDDNMNLAFLVVGLVFAYVVYKKRFAGINKTVAGGKHK